MKKYEVLHIVFDGWKKDYVNLGTFASMSEAYAFAHDMKKTMRNETLFVREVGALHGTYF